MKKLYILLILFFFVKVSFAQYGQDGIIIAAAVVLKHESEKDKYEEIEKWQNYIFAANTIIAAETTFLNKLETDIYKGLSQVDSTIEEAKMLLLIIKKSEEIYNIVDKIVTIGGDNLTIQAYTLDKQASLLFDVAFIISDYAMAKKGGKTNLMTGADRYFALEFFNKRLVKLVKKASALLAYTKYLDGLTSDDRIDELIDIDALLSKDFSDVYTAMEIRYSEIFPETLREN